MCSVASLDDVRRLALALPETTEETSRDHLAWVVKKKFFVWERPLRKTDLAALGDDAPAGPILGARVEHLIAKDAVLQSDPGVFFTTPHFDRSPIVLAQREHIELDDLEEVVTEAWLCRAPPKLAAGWRPS